MTSDQIHDLSEIILVHLERHCNTRPSKLAYLYSQIHQVDRQSAIDGENEALKKSIAALEKMSAKLSIETIPDDYREKALDQAEQRSIARRATEQSVADWSPIPF